jgi:prefoldin subunit 5
MFEVMMDKKASDMHIKILTNRIDKLETAEKNALHKLDLAKKRAEELH